MAYLNLNRDSNGWTIFTPSNDSRLCYVAVAGNDGTAQYYASSDPEIGSDPCDPDGPIDAYATYAAALADTRAGYPDWILFKRGDTFIQALGTIRNGRDLDEPSVVGAYGSSGLSPLLKTGAASGFTSINPGMQYRAVFGLNFYAHTRDPDSGDYVGNDGGYGFRDFVDTGNSTTGVLIEGCKFRFYKNNIMERSGDLLQIEFRRCIILDNYDSSAHSQGIYSSGAQLHFYECIFDHNGWYAVAGGSPGEATQYNHSMYHALLTNTTIERCIIMRGSNMAIKLTASGAAGSSHDVSIDNCLIVDSSIGVGAGSNYTTQYRFADMEIKNCVLVNMGLTDPLGLDFAWNFRIEAWDGGTIQNNYLLHQTEAGITNHFGMRFRDTIRDVNILDNVLYGLRGAVGLELNNDDGSGASNMTFSGNKIQIAENSGYTINAAYDPSGKWTFSNNLYFSNKAVGTRYYNVSAEQTLAQWQTATGDNSTFEEYGFADPTRTLQTYQEYLGQTATIQAFIDACRAQDRYSWDTDYVAPTVNDWIKAGFDNLKFSQSVELKFG